MADFLDTFKRRESESSEGSYGDEDDDNEPQFAREELHHHSDEGEDNRNDRPNAEGGNQKGSHYEENKEVGNKKGPSPHKNQNKKKDHYLYEGEEKPYESDQEEQAQGQTKSGKKDVKGEKKDPTFVPKGAFYQHDTRGDDVEYVPKKGGDKLNKYKWKHDKFEKGPKKTREGENDRNYYDKNTQIVYVAKGANQQKPEEGEQRAEPAQPREPKRQPQKQYYEKKDYRERDQGYEKKNYRERDQGYEKTDYRERDQGYEKKDYRERDQGYNNKPYAVYTKKDSNKKPAGENIGAGRNKDYYLEYVPKKQEKQ